MKAPLAILIALAAASASAQATKTPAPQAKAPDAKAPVSNTTKAATQPNTKADTKANTKANTKADTKAQAKAPAAPPAQATGTKVAPGGGAGAQRTGVVVGPPTTPAVQAPVIMRETFTYAPDTRRDPFFSLLTSAELRPTVEDLRLTGILYDETGRNSYATMRDLVTNTQYRVTTGQILGRMRVVLIKRTVVMFTIEEFGLNRQDSLFLGDSTKVRAK